MADSETSSTTLSPSQKLETGIAALRTVVGSRNLRTLYFNQPITMHKTFPSAEPMRWPLVIRAAYAQIWSGEHSRIIIKAPRGGGKSKLLGTVGFDLWYLKQRKVVNMGGSAVQATIVYNYFKDNCGIDGSVAASIDGIPKAIETRGVAGNYFSSVTASTKQTRGKHPDVFLSDETCETTDELIHSALPMVDSSQHPLVVMASTFHKIYGVFQETWDNAQERGYQRIQWDIFDVCAPFAADIWEQPEVAKINGIERLKAYAKGRTGDPEGWVPIENVLQAWREKPTEDWFEVEYMGSRPSAAGLVLKPEDIDRSVFDSDIETRYNFVKGATVVLGIDWGFSTMTSVTAAMGYANATVVVLDNKNYHQTASDEIIAEVVKMVRDHGVRFIYADSAGKFENIALQNALVKEKLPCVVIEVVFSTAKFGTPGKDGSIGMLGNLRAHFEQGKIKLPKRLREAYWQLKRYRYQEGTDKPVKKDDHVPDSLMCALQHFVLGKLSRPLPVTIETRSGGDKPITADTLKKQF